VNDEVEDFAQPVPLGGSPIVLPNGPNARNRYNRVVIFKRYRLNSCPRQGFKSDLHQQWVKEEGFSAGLHFFSRALLRCLA
jgi:hypothetical protein